MSYGIRDRRYDEYARSDAKDACCGTKEREGAVIDKNQCPYNKHQECGQASGGPPPQEAHASRALACGIHYRDAEEVQNEAATEER